MDEGAFDLMCLKALKVNAESQRIALAAASIVVHAHAIAREAPGRAEDARRIVELARELYAATPSRQDLADMVEECLAETAPASAPGIAARRRAEAARERLVDRIWRLFHHGVATRA